MLKERYNLVEVDLDKLEKDYTRYDIVNMIELSYQFTARGITLWQEILDSAFDGINAWGLFIKFCYDELVKSKDADFFDYSDGEILALMEVFKQKYYKESD